MKTPTTTIDHRDTIIAALQLQIQWMDGLARHNTTFGLTEQAQECAVKKREAEMALEAVRQMQVEL